MRKFTALGLVVLFLASSSAWAAGPGQAPKPKPQPVCNKGYVFSPARKKCVRALSAVVPDAELKAQGWALAEAGEFDAAIVLFQLVANRQDPEALNGLGYSNRKLGNVETGIAYYHQVLAIDPGYLKAREYLGEGYVIAGRPELARDQLTEIERRCGRTCEEYVELAQVIADGGAGLRAE
ncbi:MAG: tetratricopeptide repeat protein [Parvibaculaceae bacterium]